MHYAYVICVGQIKYSTHYRHHYIYQNKYKLCR